MTLRTPEQVSDYLGYDENGRPIMSANTIKSLARSNQVEHLRLERNKIAFTEDQIEKLIAARTKSAVRQERQQSVFGASTRSNSAARTAR